MVNEVIAYTPSIVIKDKHWRAVPTLPSFKAFKVLTFCVKGLSFIG